MRGVDAGLSHAEIGRRIGRDRTTIWREVRRNPTDGDYHARMADARAAQKAHRPKAFKLAENPVCASIEAWMDDGWSPKLIAQMLARDHPDDRLSRVSHETIYKCLYVQTRGSLRADLHKCLSTKRTARKPRGRTDNRRGAYSSGEEFTISDRPPEVADRPYQVTGKRPDRRTQQQCDRHAVERSTRFTMLLHLPGNHTADTVATAMIEAMRELPEHLRRSITWDRGSEMAQWRRIHLQLAAPAYFCNPHSPWQRGSNENTNRLLRFWFEKGSDLSGQHQSRPQTHPRHPQPPAQADTESRHPAERLAALFEQAA